MLHSVMAPGALGLLIVCKIPGERQNGVLGEHLQISGFLVGLVAAMVNPHCIAVSVQPLFQAVSLRKESAECV